MRTYSLERLPSGSGRTELLNPQWRKMIYFWGFLEGKLAPVGRAIFFLSNCDTVLELSGKLRMRGRVGLRRTKKS